MQTYLVGVGTDWTEISKWVSCVHHHALWHIASACTQLQGGSTWCVAQGCGTVLLDPQMGLQCDIWLTSTSARRSCAQYLEVHAVFTDCVFECVSVQLFLHSTWLGGFWHQNRYEPWMIYEFSVSSRLIWPDMWKQFHGQHWVCVFAHMRACTHNSQIFWHISNHCWRISYKYFSI